jgi:hypothetical protein
MKTAQPAKVSTMGSNYSFPEANFLAQRQSGHSAIDLPGNTKNPPSIMQQELNLAWDNPLLDGGLLHQEEEQSSSDDDDSNIDRQLWTQGQPSALTHPPL